MQRTVLPVAKQQQPPPLHSVVGVSCLLVPVFLRGTIHRTKDTKQESTKVSDVNKGQKTSYKQIVLEQYVMCSTCVKRPEMFKCSMLPPPTSLPTPTACDSERQPDVDEKNTTWPQEWCYTWHKLKLRWFVAWCVQPLQHTMPQLKYLV